MSVLNFLYELVVTLALPVAAPLFYAHPRGRERFAERLGVWNLPDGRYVWIHGASAGELASLTRLLPWIQREYPDCKVLLTSFSAVGVRTHGHLADEARVLPFDARWLVKRAIGNAQIEAFLFGETELWPGVLQVLTSRGVPLCLINGRIEDRSFGSYKAIRSLLAPLVSALKLATVTTELSRERLIALGAREDRIFVVGNTKYDREPACDIEEGDKEFRELVTNHQKVITLGSVHPGEESDWLSLVKERSLDSLLLVIAPRHLEKLGYFETVLKQVGVSFQKRTEVTGGNTVDTPVLLLDTFGELERLYSVSDLVYVGGTRVPVGGHNPFECAPYKVPICLGTEISQIREEVRQLQGVNALRVIEGRSDISHLIEQVVSGDNELQQQGERLFQLWSGSRGSVQEVEALLFAALIHDGGEDTDQRVPDRSVG